MTIPVTQYGALLAAIGCSLNFDSKRAQLEVVKIPKTTKKIVDAALEDISHFEDTSNFADGMSAIHLADEVDGQANPISNDVRGNVLNALGIVRDSKFVAQVIAQQKTNRSWHLSEEPFKCTYFGDLCTHRGIVNVPGKRGRKSTRNPEQYHVRTGSGEIQREQLVTPALDALVDAIPSDRVISVTNTGGFVFNLDEMSEEKIREIIEQAKRIQQERAGAPVAAK